MVLNIVLFLSYVILVSANNGFPVIPAQTYPIYQQNGYANPSDNQPSDISSYLQSIMIQNQSPSLNLSPSNIRQILLNRILSNQPMQPIFDQNSKDYGSNLVGFPNNPVASTPVSNYFSAPTVFEYLNNQTGTNKDNKAVDIITDEKRKRSKKRKSSNSRRKNKSQKNHNNSSKNDNANGLQDNNREASRKSRQRSRKPKAEASSHDNHTKNSENENNKKNKKRKNKESKIKNLPDEEIEVENPKPRRHHKKKPKLKDNKENIILEQQTTSKPIQEDLNLANFNEEIVEENTVARNPILEGNDLFKSIPNLPKDIVNSFNFKGLPQFNNNPSMSNFFANYENIYQSMLSNNKGTIDQREIKRNKPKRSRTNNKRKVEVKNRNSTVSPATVLTNAKPRVSPKINVVNTENSIDINEKTRTIINPIPKDEDLKSVDKPSEVKQATVIESKNEEFEDTKDIESNTNFPASNYDHYDGGYIDDYYPLFTDNVGYTANNREVYTKNLGDTKYYYAIDKGNPDLINRMRFEGFGLPQRVIKDYELNKKCDDTGKQKIKNDVKPDFKDIKEEVIQFRSPPQLESPDFQTRKVEKSEINPKPYYNFDENEDFDHRFVEDKASIYSEAKIPHYSGIKQNSRKILKDKHKEVETVFARSKIANYGPVYYPEEDFTSAGTSNPASTDDSNLKDEGINYVYATTLDYPN